MHIEMLILLILFIFVRVSLATQNCNIFSAELQYFHENCVVKSDLLIYLMIYFLLYASLLTEFEQLSLTIVLHK